MNVDRSDIASNRSTTRMPLQKALLSLAILQCLALPGVALAQSEPQAKADSEVLDAVVVTGSRLRRVAAETALPVEIVTREEIQKRGVTTAAELIKSLTANTAPLGDGASITDGTSGQRGFNGANLRGIGVSSTLILLNGRRLANFASPGDEAGVDLNNIPAGAIERVEVHDANMCKCFWLGARRAWGMPARPKKCCGKVLDVPIEPPN